MCALCFQKVSPQCVETISRFVTCIDSKPFSIATDERVGVFFTAFFPVLSTRSLVASL